MFVIDVMFEIIVFLKNQIDIFCNYSFYFKFYLVAIFGDFDFFQEMQRLTPFVRFYR